MAGSKRQLGQNTRQTAGAAIDYVIDIVDLEKRFQRKTLGRGAYTTIKSSLLQLFRSRTRQGQVTQAIKHLTLRIPKGLSVGIIGRNGSGKSTLLKLITGIYHPDSGSVSVKGRVAALIELGAGFHPDFSGRENIFLGGVMHGLTKAQIEDRFEKIVEFAELNDVIDDPVRTYSSGMYMRLGFSLAIHTDPDVLLVDEVLAVGDEAFVAKCKDKIADLRREGKTLLLVTHDLGAVERWCDEALWIDKGEVRDRGEPRRVIDAYRQFVERGEEQDLRRDQVEEAEVKEPDTTDVLAPQRWGSREVEILSVSMRDSAGGDHLIFHPEDGVLIECRYLVRQAVPDVVFGIGIHRSDGLAVHGSNTEIEEVSVPDLGTHGVLRYRISRLGLLEGKYSLDLAVHRSDGYPFDYHRAAVTFSVRSPIKQVGVCVPEHSWEFEVGAVTNTRAASSR